MDIIYKHKRKKMSLEVLKDIKEIGGYSVVDMVSLKDVKPELFREDSSMKYELFERDIRPNNFIYIRRDVNSIAFTIQNGPIKENGVNGCQVATLIHTAKHIISKLNDSFPCQENEKAIQHLQEAIQELDKRKANIEKPSVEEFNKI